MGTASKTASGAAASTPPTETAPATAAPPPAPETRELTELHTATLAMLRDYFDHAGQSAQALAEDIVADYGGAEFHELAAEAGADEDDALSLVLDALDAVLGDA